MNTVTLIIIAIAIMLVFILVVKTPHKNTGFSDTVIEFRAGKLMEVQK